MRGQFLCTIALAIALFSSAATAQTNPLWHEVKTKNYLPHMTWPEVRDLLTRSDVAMIPVPAIEQHGPQAPMGTDYYRGGRAIKAHRPEDGCARRPRPLGWSIALPHGFSGDDHAFDGHNAARI